MHLYWTMGVAHAIGSFASILAHELGHAVVARRFDLHMRGITLFIFGGVTKMDKSLQMPGSSVRENNAYMLKGDAPAAIPAFANEQAVDLVVMGTVPRSGAAGVIIGNAGKLNPNSIECFVLAIKPDSFVSTITLGDDINPSHKSSEP